RCRKAPSTTLRCFMSVMALSPDDFAAGRWANRSMWWRDSEPPSVGAGPQCEGIGVDDRALGPAAARGSGPKSSCDSLWQRSFGRLRERRIRLGAVDGEV